MARRHKPKPGYLGPAFYAWLQHLEMCESIASAFQKGDRFNPRTGRHIKYIREQGYNFNNELFPQFGGTDMQDTMNEMLYVDSWLAGQVRASTKYTVDVATLRDAREKYEGEFEFILETMIVDAPFPRTTICFTGMGPDDIVVHVSELDANDDGPNNRSHLHKGEISGDTYKNLELSKGNTKFYSAAMCFHRTRGEAFGRDAFLEVAHNPDNLKPSKLSMVPVELHFNKGRLIEDTIFLNALAPGIDVSERGKITVEMVRQLMLNFFATFWLSSALRKRQLGRPPDIGLRAPSHKRKKRDKPTFEHYVVEFEIDEPEPEQTGMHIDQPRKKRHEVHGFPRRPAGWREDHTKVFMSGPAKGKRVTWVQGHWRGDARLGIVKKDHEVTLHED